MNPKGSNSPGILCLMGEFEELRRVLMGEAYALHRERPLAAWVESSDRRLPIPLLPKTVGEILTTPFQTLFGTPGVGQKKMACLLQLLDRVRRTDPTLLYRAPLLATPSPPAMDYARSDSFDPSNVSEVMWERWRESARVLLLEEEPLGRLAPTLRTLTKSIWTRPVGYYLNFSLAELRQLQTHGDKRVGAVLQVFYHIHQVAKWVSPHLPLGVRPIPWAILRAEMWVEKRLLQSAPQLDALAVPQQLCCPLLEQVQIDGKEVLVHLARARLGLDGPRNSIRQISRKLGLTRARIYQLLREIAGIMQVRWPEGHFKVKALIDHLGNAPRAKVSPEVIPQLQLALEVFFGEYCFSPSAVSRRSFVSQPSLLAEDNGDGFSPDVREDGAFEIQN
jgi:hypothetical protein